LLGIQFTFPGGNIVFLSGLIQKAESPEEVAAVFAHEMGHVQQRHILKFLIRSTILTATLNVISGNFAQMLVIDPATLWSLAALKFDRDMEREADQWAITHLKAARVDLKGYKNFFSRDSLMKNIPVLISTHPGDEERTKMIESAMSSLDPSEPVLTDDEFKSLKKICF